MPKKQSSFSPWPLLAVAELAVVILLARELWLLPDGKLHAHFFDVGQGDSALLVTPSGKQIVIDGGPNETVLQRLGEYMPLSDRSIDLLVLTHPDQDHLFGFPAILRRYDVAQVLLTGVEKDNARYGEFLRLLKEEGSTVTLADPAQDIDMGDGVTLDIVWPPAGLLGQTFKKSNDMAIVLRALYHDHSILFAADVERAAENQILETGADLRADVLKVPHHGSRTSSSTGFLLAVDPQLAIISSARDSQYGHPHPDVVERYRHFGIPVRMTGREGTISVEF